MVLEGPAAQLAGDHDGQRIYLGGETEGVWRFFTQTVPGDKALALCSIA
jgi:hypothetical protein